MNDKTIIDEAPTEDITSVNIETEMRKSYLDYAMSVIVSRALPDVCDGLKPVHRRILHAMNESGYVWNKAYKKSARIVGDVVGKYHPHGEQSVYDALVRLAQDFSLRLPLVDGQGNFGSLDGDKAAAMRYTEVRLKKVTQYLLEDINLDTVDFRANYDNSEREPIVLPTRFPNILVNGAGGIAVGMATSIPPHNLGEIIEASLAIINNPDIEVAELLTIIQGPDFPTGGIICGREGIRNIHKTGRGSLLVRSKTHKEELPNNKEAIIVTEIPYQINKATMIQKIAELVKEKKIEDIQDIRDESNRDGVRVYIELKRNANFDVVLNQLYRFSSLQTNIACYMVALHKGMPKQMNIKEILSAFIDFRKEVVTRRTRFLLNKARQRAHILVGYAVVITHIDEVIRIIRNSQDAARAKESLLTRQWEANEIVDILGLIEDKSNNIDATGFFTLSEEQVKAILELRLQRLTAMGLHEIDSELKEIAQKIKDYLGILSDNERILAIITQEMKDISEEFSSPRRTQIIDFVDNCDDEELIQREDMVITYSYKGYIKRVPLSTYRSQKRGGKGRSGMTIYDDDFVTQLFVANTHTSLLFFSSKGLVYKEKVWRLPEGGPQTKGKPLINILDVDNNEKITSILPLPDNPECIEAQSIIFATKKGKIRRNRLSDFMRVNRGGKIAMKLEESDDEIVGTQICSDQDDVMVFCRSGKCIRFPVVDLRVFSSRDSTGVRAISMQGNDDVVSMTIVKHVEASSEELRAYLKKKRSYNNGNAEDGVEEGSDVVDNDRQEEQVMPYILSDERYEELERQEQLLITVAENGYGKRSSSYDYRVTKRGGKGILAMNINKKTGFLCTAFPVTDTDGLMLVTDTGKLIRCEISDIAKIGRTGQGVRVFRVSENERTVSIVHIPSTNNPEDEEDKNTLVEHNTHTQTTQEKDE